ncbi:Carbamoyl-phosphate synthase small chain [Dehalobacter sp. UNSWDHB]|uniref:carbamoyl phosphate synthase small subunit n=1 Tax=unclassified Dehalobacter TaxID=2635733 RepID=UPI00028B8717|nr:MULTISPECIES: carbamoyl phosphate synthase small subunit [unclassified Dehalobacter]AFV03363.1 Carbamoyl-phosphate synthase small chain [Dehalobacter sp. DCA]AFV06350.1 Carbamoyl-phosphate synthase small chain [Dehalobacter sp. CF]EQB21510.1 Carbamoyl-phosphate synthase small chain [Dehalobacter sp. UNSWDHB]
MQQNVYIILANGQVFKGKPFGAAGEAVGEIVFTTAMTGYLETLTDPSYYGQIVVQTFPLIGNYGIIPDDFENDSPKLKAYVVREWCQVPSNFRCEGELDAFLRAQNIVGVYGVDTRELTKIIREVGVMNAKITATLDNLEKDLAEINQYKITDAVQKVSARKTIPVGDVVAGRKTDKAKDTTVAGDTTGTKEVSGKYRVVLWDFGAKENIRRELIKRGCEVITVSAEAIAESILNLKPDGIMLSNGPGDPADNPVIIEELAKLSASGLPIFGICLGHQLLALAQGAKTSKLKYGHRGANQPVKDLKTGRVYITSQNHGYAVVADSLPTHACMRFQNANDGTCEGIEYLNMPAFSAQFHPEASAGPLDTSYLFDQFIDLMRKDCSTCR